MGTTSLAKWSKVLPGLNKNLGNLATFRHYMHLRSQ